MRRFYFYTFVNQLTKIKGMKKLSLLLITAVLTSSTSYSQEKPHRLGFTFGLPNIVGLNFEYVTPSLNNKLSTTLDYSSIKLKDGEIDFNYSYFELGGNYYFGQKSKGLYGHLSYGRIGFKGNYSNPIYGSGEGKVSLNMINLMLGAKLGNRVYIKPEVGFASFFNEAIVRVEYTEPATNLTLIVEEEIPNFLKDGLIYSLGIGLSF
tara:strand:- start:93 stop:713 length:621 start_codon:yes stop_codon:yes gene_type:complete